MWCVEFTRGDREGRECGVWKVREGTEKVGNVVCGRYKRGQRR